MLDACQAAAIDSLIGDADCRACHDPQALKQVWHILARFGDLSAG